MNQVPFTLPSSGLGGMGNPSPGPWPQQPQALTNGRCGFAAAGVSARTGRADAKTDATGRTDVAAASGRRKKGGLAAEERTAQLDLHHVAQVRSYRCFRCITFVFGGVRLRFSDAAAL